MASEVEKELDLTIIRYSRVVEDHRVLTEALQINADHDVVLSITSSGDNILNLLLEKPKKIVAVDISIAQNSILELKIAAITYLNYQKYLTLIGEVFGSAIDRKEIYEDIKDCMPQYARDYWDSHLDMITEGLSSCGRFQKYIFNQFVHHISEVVDPTKLNAFFEADNLDEQRKLFLQLPLQDIKAVLSDFVVNQISGRSTAQLKYVTLSGDEMIELMWKRFYSTAMNVPVRDNFYFSLFMRGQRSTNFPSPDYLLPPYLTRDGFEKLKGLVDRIEVCTGSIGHYLLSTSIKFHKMNMSDIFEYMSPEDSDALFSQLNMKTLGGGHLAYWNLFTQRYPPTHDCKLKFMEQHSLQCRKIDRVFFFEFCVLQRV